MRCTFGKRIEVGTHPKTQVPRLVPTKNLSQDVAGVEGDACNIVSLVCGASGEVRGQCHLGELALGIHREHPALDVTPCRSIKESCVIETAARDLVVGKRRGPNDTCWSRSRRRQEEGIQELEE